MDVEETELMATRRGNDRQAEGRDIGNSIPSTWIQPDGRVIVEVDDDSPVGRDYFNNYLDELARLGVLHFACMMMIKANHDLAWSYPSRTKFDPTRSYTDESLKAVFWQQFEMTGPFLHATARLLQGTDIARKDLLVCWEVDVGSPAGSRVITANITPIDRSPPLPEVELRSI